MKSTLRLLIAASLVTSFAAGCAKTPFGPQAVPVGMEEMDALSSPVNNEAVSLARTWKRDATQVGVMINRSPKGVQDKATYVFASRQARMRMLIVIATAQGLQAQEVAVNERTAEALASSQAITEKQGNLLNSKKLFKKAEHAGLRGAEDLVITQVRENGKTLPVAIVTDATGQNYMVMNALTGEAMTGVSKLGARKVQVHILVIGAAVVAVAVGAAVWWAVKKWREKDNKPTPTPQPTGQPTSQPTPFPTATPVPTPVPTSKPSGKVAELVAGPWGDMFARLDSDKDGVLTITEYLKPAKDETTQRVKDTEWREFIDVRHTGKVDRNGFLMGVERSLNNLCDMSFSMLDSNQNGGLDTAEAGNAVKQADFAAADTNRDGSLSRAEYIVPFVKKEALFAPHYK